ncbi:MAG TPA: HisA/HisF-related TIM barrel protein [Polyangiaceae bacterium]|nr:HisA/HisF-related TIM barrel protein [Polyangiaceae bacterium]
MLTKRVIACLDVVKGGVTKAVKFQDNIAVAPALDVIRALYEQGIDEVIFFDILASAERRGIDLGTVREVARHVFVPFTVGGGLKSLEDMRGALKAGAEKVSIDSMAVRNPAIIGQGAAAFGRQCVVVSMQVRRVPPTASIPSGYEVAIDGARVFTGKDAIAWAREAVERGAGELCINSIDRDGTCAGYDLELMHAVCSAVEVPVIASGGAGSIDNVIDVFQKTDASAAIVSSMLYSPRLPRNFPVAEIKAGLRAAGIPVRPEHEQAEPGH